MTPSLNRLLDLARRSVAKADDVNNTNATRGTFAVGPKRAEHKPARADFEAYRQIRLHPTVALARAAVEGPVLAGQWQITSRDDATDDMRRLVERYVLPLRQLLLKQAMRSLDFGWQPLEIVWQQDDAGRFCPKAAKPLPVDLTEMLVDSHGHFAGLQVGDVTLEPAYALAFLHDVEPESPYGRSRHENVRDAWEQWRDVDRRAGQLAHKTAGIVPVVHYPPGEMTDAAGNTIPNDQAARSLLGSLVDGRGVAIPNLFAQTDDPRVGADLAGRSAWLVDFLDGASDASAMGGLTERQRYYDALMLRGWLVPERSAVEASVAGSRADAEVHNATGMLNCAQLHADFVRQINWHFIDKMLTINFGSDASGAIEIEVSDSATSSN